MQFRLSNTILNAKYAVVIQAMAFDATAWAMEHFELNGQNATKKLLKYLHSEEVQRLIPDFDKISSTEQQKQLVILAAQQGGEFINKLLQDMSGQDIQQASSQPAHTADAIIEMFKEGTSHALQAWADSEQASNHLSAFLGKLGLEPQQFDSPLAAVVHAMHGPDNQLGPTQLEQLTQVRPHRVASFCKNCYMHSIFSPCTF